MSGEDFCDRELRMAELTREAGRLAELYRTSGRGESPFVFLLQSISLCADGATLARILRDVRDEVARESEHRVSGAPR